MCSSDLRKFGALNVEIDESEEQAKFGFSVVRDHAPGSFYRILGQTHVNGWSRVIASQNGGPTSYVFPLKLKVLQ